MFPNESVLLDVGANVGCYSLIAGSLNRFGKESKKFFAFETSFYELYTTCEKYKT